MKTIIFILVIIILIALAAFFLRQSKVSSPTTPVTPPENTQPSTFAPSTDSGPVVAPAEQTAPAAASVSITNFSFTPAHLSVKVNTTVTWTNHDAMAHTVTGTTGGPSSGTIANGQSYSYTFTTPGTYDYACSFHPNMKGTVTVTP